MNLRTKLERATRVTASAEIDQQAMIFLKTLAAIAFWSGGDLDRKKMADQVSTWHDQSEPFLTKLTMVKPVRKALTTLVRMIAEGAPPTADAEAAMSTVGMWLSGADRKLEAEPDLARFTFTGIRKVAQYYRNGSKGAYDWLVKNAAKISNSLGKDASDNEVSSQVRDVVMLADLIEKLVGRRDIKLTELEKEGLRETHPEEYQQVLDARRRVLATAKVYIRMVVRKAGGYMKYSELREQMRDDHVFHDLPAAENWDGYIDEDGKLYTKQKKEIKGKPGFLIEGNPEYNPKTNDTFVFSVKTSMGNTQYFYTVDSLESWREDRFEAVDDFAPMIEEVRGRWLSDMKSSQHKTKTLACLCETLYWTSGRIGATKNNVRGSQTFGISTLQGQHVSKVGANLVLDYVGKTGVRQKHVLKPATTEQKLLASQLLKWAETAGDEGYIFDIVGDRHTTPPTNGTVNGYFKSKGATVTVHKLRHARAAGIMDRLMRDGKKCGYFRYKGDDRVLIMARKPTPQEAESKFKELASDVGKELGHTAGEKVTWTTATQNYIPPTITLNFFRDTQTRIPAWAERLKSQKMTD